jgi:hypothetical protein
MTNLDRKKTEKQVRAAVKDFSRAHAVDPKKSVLIGGAAMYMHGLREDLNDIDVIHPDLPEFSKSTHRGLELDAGPGSHMPGRAGESVKIRGFRVQSLPGLLDFYQDLNRPKDQPRIARLKEILKVGSGINPDMLQFFADELLQQ